VEVLGNAVREQRLNRSSAELKEPRIGFVSLRSPHDRKSWSGTNYQLFRALQRVFNDVVFVEMPRTRLMERIGGLVNRVKSFLGDHGEVIQSVPMSTLYGREYRKAILKARCDVVFAPAASTEIAYLNSPVPVVYLTDTTFEAMVDYYYPKSEVHAVSHWQANNIERRALNRSAAVIFSNDWAMKSAVEHYHADIRKMSVIPFGANLDNVPPAGELNRGSNDGVCRMLLVGRDWKRKGGQIALDAFNLLVEKYGDSKFELTIVGCAPSKPVERPGLTVIPHIDKNKPGGLERIEGLYRNADIFLLPTQAECSAVAFCEAAAYGLPVVTTDTGGTATIVIDGITGSLLPVESGPEQFAAKIDALWRDPNLVNMRAQARQRYDEMLNWNSWASKTREIILQVLKGSKASQEM
jgi:glycosyltransferase involved in cell wall biosynthesis